MARIEADRSENERRNSTARSVHGMESQEAFLKSEDAEKNKESKENVTICLYSTEENRVDTVTHMITCISSNTFINPAMLVTTWSYLGVRSGLSRANRIWNAYRPCKAAIACSAKNQPVPFCRLLLPQSTFLHGVSLSPAYATSVRSKEGGGHAKKCCTKY